MIVVTFTVLLWLTQTRVKPVPPAGSYPAVEFSTLTREEGAAVLAKYGKSAAAGEYTLAVADYTALSLVHRRVLLTGQDDWPKGIRVTRQTVQRLRDSGLN